MADTLPLLTHRAALTRLLKGFALRLGLDDSMADVVAQVHLQQEQSTEHWNHFIKGNCASCARGMNSCPFLAPSIADCFGSATPDNVRVANFLMVETGRIDRCPAHLPHTQDASDV